jgi:hypothetical protein
MTLNKEIIANAVPNLKLKEIAPKQQEYWKLIVKPYIESYPIDTKIIFLHLEKSQ